MDPRFLKEEGPDVFTGNELILKGALEAGCSLITGYPGSPISELFDAAFSNRALLQSLGTLAEMANNEALAVARLNGARMAGVRALAAMKSVGLHVAADGLALGNLAEPDNEGGCVVVVGDDTWIESTQINNDSRYLSQHLHMPVVEPSTLQELKDWINEAFKLSSIANLYITYLVTTPQADGGGTVWVRSNQRPKINTQVPVTIDSSTINLDKNVLLPPRTWEREKTLPQRFETLWRAARAQHLNHLEKGADRRMGFVAAGICYTYLTQALQELGLAGHYAILKPGVTYPLDPALVLDFAATVDALCIVEEKRGFLETQAAEILRAARQNKGAYADIPVWGKQFPQNENGFPVDRGLNVELVAERLRVLLGTAKQESSFIELPLLPSRTPTFCPGCPHRDSSSVFLEIQKSFQDASYMQRTHRRKPVDLIFHGETGCFTMLMFEPNQPLMHNYSGMGIGGGTGAGADPFITNKQVVFLGDSTFFHSGLIAISDSLKNNQDITYVILDNKTTAMTGHQPTPGTDLNLMGERTYAQNIEAIVQAMAGQGVPVTRLNPGARDDYRRLLERTVLQDGVKVIIADKECGLVVERRVRESKKNTIRQNGFLALERFIQITPEVCEFCMVCTQTTGCPGLGFVDTPDGTKIRTDPSLCVSDGACAKIQACPAFEEVTVMRKQAPAASVLPPNADHLTPNASSKKDPFYIHIAGVGGQGAGLLSAVLAKAAHADGWRVLFTEKKGLAVRNGAVYGQLTLTRDGGTRALGIPAGQADVVLGLDLLETLRSVDPKGAHAIAQAQRTAIIVNQATQPTIRMLIGKNKTTDVPAAEQLAPFARPDGLWSVDLSAISQNEFGDKRYANLMLLGAALQLGRLPLSQGALEAAIQECAPRSERDINQRAFNRGRDLAFLPLQQQANKISLQGMIPQWAERIARRRGKRLAGQYQRLTQETLFALDGDDAMKTDVARHLYDLIAYDGIRYAGSYAKLVLRVAARDQVRPGFAATRAVIANAYKVMAIKDEFFVAHLLTREEKYAQDRRRFNVDERRGDQLTYSHFNEPEIFLFGRRWRIKVKTRDWQLKLMARLSFLRPWLPAWHVREKAFRDWYLALARQFNPVTAPEYDGWVTLLELPRQVRGYRDIRYPQMDHARQQADALLSRLSKVYA